MSNASLKNKDNTHDNIFELIACPVCNNEDLKPFFKIRYGELKQKESLDYSSIGITKDTLLYVMECKKCRFVFINPRIKPHYQDTIYNDCKKNMYFNKPHLLAIGSDRHTVTSRKNKIGHIKALLETLSYVDLDDINLSLFDYGCGFGYSMSLAREFGIDAFGVDIDRERLSVCKSLGLKVSEPDEFDVRYPDVKADIILCQNNLEHIVDLQATLNYLKTKSKPGAILYINGLTPKVIAIEKRRGKFVNAHFVEHINFFPIRTLDYFMAQYGFRPLKHTYTSSIKTYKDAFKGPAAYFIQNTFGRNPLTGNFKRMYKYSPEG